MRRGLGKLLSVWLKMFCFCCGSSIIFELVTRTHARCVQGNDISLIFKFVSLWLRIFRMRSHYLNSSVKILLPPGPIIFSLLTHLGDRSETSDKFVSSSHFVRINFVLCSLLSAALCWLNLVFLSLRMIPKYLFFLHSLFFVSILFSFFC